MKDKAVGTTSLAEFAKCLTKPRAVWLMVPVGAVDQVLADLLPHLERSYIVVDGGNSYYIDDITAEPRSWRRGASILSRSSRAAVSRAWSAAIA